LQLKRNMECYLTWAHLSISTIETTTPHALPPISKIN
jgi:hypothetical protein